MGGRRIAIGGPQRLSRQAEPAGLDGSIFAVVSSFNDAVASGLADGARLPVLLPLLFAAGLASSLNPCNAATLPVAAASVTALAQDRVGTAGQAVAFAAGSAVVVTALGLAVSLAGERLPLGEGLLLWLFPLVAVTMGLSLLGLLPLRFPVLSAAQALPATTPRELQGFLLGATSAAGSSPCATPVLVTVTSYLAAHPQNQMSSATLLLAYSLGYSAPLALVSLFAGSLPWLQAGSRWGPLLSGAAILAVGTVQLLGAIRQAYGSGASELCIEVLTGVVLLSAVALRLQPQSDGRPAVKVEALPGQQGVYRYTPMSASDEASPNATRSAGPDSRRVALTSVCAGTVLAAGTQVLPFLAGETRDEAAQLIRAAAARSRPLAAALQSGRPVVVDFSATWCIECLQLAPTVRDLERTFGSRVEFVTLDVSDWAPAPAEGQPARSRSDAQLDWWVRQFRVDGLPHLAFIAPNGYVLTALVGNLPADVVRADVEALRELKGGLPYLMYDAFEGGKRQLTLPSQAGVGA